MRDGGNAVEIGHIQFGIADGFRVDGFGLRCDGRLQRLQIIGLHKIHLYSQTGEGVMKQIVRSAIEIIRRDNFITGLGDIQKRQRDGRLAARDRQRADTAVEQREPFLQHIGGGIHEPRVNIAELLESE